MKKNEFYRLDEILKHKAKYNILLGERSNGKSFSVKERIIKLALQENKLIAGIIRRYDEDIKTSIIQSYFNDIALLEMIEKISKGKYNSVVFYQGRFFFAKTDDSGKTEKGFAFARVFSISSDEMYKSSTVEPYIRIIAFEEFTTNKHYLINEVSRFMNLCSTIIRLEEAEVYMIANKVSRVCVYFSDWSLRGIPSMKEGQIDDYIFKDVQGTEVKIAVELCASPQHKKSGMFFGRIGKQIDGGAWECSEHPKIEGDLRDYEHLYELTVEHMDFKFNVILAQHYYEDFICVIVYPATLLRHKRVLTEEYSSNELHTPTLLKRIKAEVMIYQLWNENKFVYPTNLIAEDFLTVIKNMKRHPFTLV